MERIHTHNIAIGEEKFPFRFSIISYMKYFDLTGKEATTIKTTEDAINYFYCAYKSGCDYEKQEIKLQLEDWLNLVDDYPECLEVITKRFESSVKKK